TAKIAHSYGATVIVNQINQGCSVSKNRAREVASAPRVHFYDAEDELLPNSTTLVQGWAAAVDEQGVILFGYEYRDNAPGELIGRSNFDDQALREDPLRYAILNQINPFCGLYRRNRLVEVGGHDVDPEVLYNEDVAFHCKLALAGFSF